MKRQSKRMRVRRVAVAELVEVAARCFLCNNPVPGDAYCYGCRLYICRLCDVHTRPYPHLANNHLEVP